MRAVVLPLVWFVSFGSLGACAGSGTGSTEDSDGDGYSEQDGDCNDADAGVFPGAEETCDGVDQDCDTVIDNAPVDQLWYTDADQDGYGDTDSAVGSCVVIVGRIETGGDCDDSNAAIHPGATEHCDDVDEDCDGVMDEEAVDAITYYEDLDQDGYGGSLYPLHTCYAAIGYADNSDDCDDTRNDVHPGARDEPGDGLDADCSHDTYVWDSTNGPEAAVATITGNHGAHFPTCVVGLGDIDLDGYGDVYIGDAALDDASATDAGYFYPGPLSGALTPANAKEVLDWGTSTGAHGTSCAAIGDVNDNGTDDLLIGAPGVGADAMGSVSVYLGERLNAWDAQTPDATAQDSTAGSGFGATVSGADDVDADGITDVLVAGVNASGTGVVHLYSGADWASWSTDSLAEITGDGRLGETLAALGDVNGDGHADFALGAPAKGDDAGVVEVRLGGGDYGVWATVSGTTAGIALGSGLAADDIDQDGVTDLVVSGHGGLQDGFGTTPGGETWVFSGAALRSGATSPDDALVHIVGGPMYTYASWQVAAPGDVNGDEVPDLLVSGADPAGGIGQVGLFAGPLSGTLAWDDTPQFVGADSTAYGALIVSLGDTNRDGHGDWAVLGENGESPILYVYQGRAE